MSTCKHNDHGHMMLWLVLFFTMRGSCLDSEKVQTLQRENSDLRDRVGKLEWECVRK